MNQEHTITIDEIDIEAGNEEAFNFKSKVTFLLTL